MSQRQPLPQGPENPAVVLGAGVNGLGVVRSLAQSGVPVWLVDGDLHAPAMRTRYGRKLKAPAMAGSSLVDWLVALGQCRFSKRRPVLFLTQEDSVRTVSEARDKLMPYYRLVLPEHRLLVELMHKEDFYRHARAAGSPVPLTLHLRGPQDLSQVSQMRFPAVLKPGRHDHAYAARFKKAYRIDDRDGAIARCHEILSVLPDLILQEWIEGEDSDIFFCLQYIGGDGKKVATFTGRKIRSWPPQVGGTASCMAAPEAHAVLDRLTSDFFSATGFVGMGSMEYKRDRSSGRYFMVEPTVGRTDYQEEVATLNGTNIPFAAYCHELGLPVPDGAATHNVLWRHTMIDRWSAEIQGQNRGRDNLDPSRAVDAYWRAYDPAPWLFMQGYSVLNRLKHRARRLVSARGCCRFI